MGAEAGARPSTVSSASRCRPRLGRGLQSLLLTKHDKEIDNQVSSYTVEIITTIEVTTVRAGFIQYAFLHEPYKKRLSSGVLIKKYSVLNNLHLMHVCACVHAGVHASVCT